ncbi:MAG: hypothetical protein WDM77_14165 [Steroidobacteraceae bacterium]
MPGGARTLAEWLTLQEQVHARAIDLGLGRVGTVARTLGVERPGYRVITVGGTNGKGSTVATLEALLLALGWRVGTLTSPHLLRYNERIRIGGREASDAQLVDVFERIEVARGLTTLTFFEYNTLAALLLFADQPVDIAVLEVGLGGRLDAVNLVDADVGVLCFSRLRPSRLAGRYPGCHRRREGRDISGASPGRSGYAADAGQCLCRH